MFEAICTGIDTNERYQSGAGVWVVSKKAEYLLELSPAHDVKIFVLLLPIYVLMF